MKRLKLAILFLGLQAVVWGQKKADDIKSSDFEKLTVWEDSIARLAKTIIEDSLPENRVKANDKLLPLMRQFMAVSNSFNFQFSKVAHLAIQTAPDGEFRVITWGFFPNNKESKHYGFIQLNRAKSVFYELKDATEQIKKPETDIVGPEKWFGALYYNIKPFKTKDGMKYLLFGMNFGDFVEKTKVCDVLVLRGSQVRFGSQVFEIEERGTTKKLTRLVMPHAYTSSMRLNYDEDMDLLIFDHLEPIASERKDVPFVMVPDGTYEAFELKKGTWEHIKQLKNNVLDEAPRPQPVLGKKGKVVSKENAKQFSWPEELLKKSGNDE